MERNRSILKKTLNHPKTQAPYLSFIYHVYLTVSCKNVCGTFSTDLDKRQMLNKVCFSLLLFFIQIILLLLPSSLTWQVTGQTNIQPRINLEEPICSKSHFLWSSHRTWNYFLFNSFVYRMFSAFLILVYGNWDNCFEHRMVQSWNMVEVMLQITTRGKKRVRQHLRRNTYSGTSCPWCWDRFPLYGKLRHQSQKIILT